MESAEVSRIVDGDTIKVILGGRLQTIRYIGIDTPETKHSNKPIECFGAEASRFNQQLVSGKPVILEKDTTDRDRYGRLLRYVWVEGVGLVNQVLVENGYARVYSFPPDVKYESILISAESFARENMSGLWSACGEPSMNTDSVVPDADSSGDNCSPSYPTICIP
ncbi:MAG: thermonuclease family protein, partial [Chloroflexota bacterium]|nr:thermonuclease family protein [Chloroflexota bacterium]